MRAHILHALRSAAERRPLGAALFLNALVPAVFVVSWGDGRGIPQFAHVAFYVQARAVELLLLTALLPWTVVRVAPMERGDDLATLAAITAIRPSRIAVARTGALFVIAISVALVALPVLVIAGRMSGVGPVDVMRGQLASVAIAALATVMGSACTLVLESRVAAWGAATCGTAAVCAAAIAWAPSTLAASAISAGIAIILGVGVSARCDSSHRYPAEAAA